MAWLTLEEAAARIGAPREALEEWVRHGLLAVHTLPRQEAPPLDAPGLRKVEQYVDEDELFERAESLGWFELSAENWDGEEGE
jgi:hypothetical protein